MASRMSKAGKASKATNLDDDLDLDLGLDLDGDEDGDGLVSPTPTHVPKIAKELTKLAGTFSREQMRTLVDFYYDVQRLRVGAGNKESAHNRRVDVNADPLLIRSLKEGLKVVEENTQKGMREYVRSQPMGRWAISIPGIEATLAGGLLANIDFTVCGCRQYQDVPRRDRPPHPCPGLLYVGYILSFAGQLDPLKQQWAKGQKRPYNVRFKNLCWKISEAWKKLSVNEGKSDEQLATEIKAAALKKGEKIEGTDLTLKIIEKRERMAARAKRLHQDDYLYVRLYMQRKRWEVERNESGGNRERAQGMLEDALRRRRSLSPEQKDCWASGKLQPIGLDRRAARYAVRIFLSHYHYIGYQLAFGVEPPKPWAIVHGGHKDYIPPVNWPILPTGEDLRKFIPKPKG